MHIDLDYFFAQVEERENSSLKDKPVVVCVYSGRTEHSGAVSTANYIARKFGVKSGMPIMLAEKILSGKDAVFLAVNHELYDKVSDKVMGIINEFGDKFEQVSVDEAFIDVTKRLAGDFEKAEEFVAEVKKTIKSKERLTCSVGVGPNKLIAKMASSFKKPDGLTVVKPPDVKKFLNPMPVGKLYGIGEKTEEKMGKLGVKTIEDLARIEVSKLIEIFGKKLGTYFHLAANGIDNEPVQDRESAESLSRIATLKEDTRNLESMIPVLNRLSEEVKVRLDMQNLNCASVGVITVMEDLTLHSKSRTLDSPTEDIETIKSILIELLEMLLKDKTDLNIRRLGVKVSKLSEKGKQKPINEFFEVKS